MSFVYNLYCFIFFRGYGWGAGHAEGTKRAKDRGKWNRDQPSRPEYPDWKHHTKKKQHWGQEFHHVTANRQKYF